MQEALISDAGEGKEKRRGFYVAGMPLWAIVFLVLTAVVSLAIGHYSLINGDDILEIWSDRAGSLGQVWHIQRTSPLVIDPFFYHGLTFFGIRVFGIRPFFLRLPSLLGFMVMQVCLFYFVRRIASVQAAVFALAFPMVTGGFLYTVEVRPYGVLLGLFGLAMLSWQTASRRDEHRSLALVMLALSIAAAINSQYYGVLLMLPLCAGEAVRILKRRRPDKPMLLSLCTGLAGMVFLFPFMKGAAEFRAHYKAGNVPYQSITQTYNFLVLGQSTFSQEINHLLAILLGFLVVLVFWGCIRLRQSQGARLPDSEFAFLLTLAGLPAFAFLLGHFVTHAMESRYAIGALLGISVLLSIALAPVLRNRIARSIVFAALLAWFGWNGMVVIRESREYWDRALASMVITPQVMAAIMASPTQMLYTQDIDLVGFLAFHDANANVLRHVALVYSVYEEMRWNHSETDSRIVENLKSFTPYTILPYESVMKQPVGSVFVLTHGGWNWMDKAFASGQVPTEPVGEAFGGEVVRGVHPPGSQRQLVP